MNEHWIMNKILLEFVHNDPVGSIPALVQIMAWRQTGDKPLSKPVFRLVYWRILMHHAASMSLQHGRSWTEPMCVIFLGNYLRKYKNAFIFSICHWDGVGSWNITLWITNTLYKYYMLNAMVADGLATHQLIHRGRDKITANFLTTISNAFSWVKK